MKITPGTIVVGVDGSPSATSALEWAAAQARAEHRPITLVHAVGAVSPAWIDEAIADSREANLGLRQQAQAVLDEAHGIVAKHAPTVEVHEHFRLEDPREVLLELSATAEMIVVGSRGRGPVRRLLLGSVGVALIRHAECPVVVHRPSKPGAVHQGVAVGADGSPESGVVLEFAYRQAALRDLPLTVVHCAWDVPFPVPTIQSGTATEERAEEERLLLSEAMAGLGEKYPEVRVQVELAHGMPENALVAASEKMNLLVLGTRQQKLSTRLIHGSVSLSVLEHALGVVAVVPLIDRS